MEKAIKYCAIVLTVSFGCLPIFMLLGAYELAATALIFICLSFVLCAIFMILDL